MCVHVCIYDCLYTYMHKMDVYKCIGICLCTCICIYMYKFTFNFRFNCDGYRMVRLVDDGHRLCNVRLSTVS